MAMRRIAGCLSVCLLLALSMGCSANPRGSVGQAAPITPRQALSLAVREARQATSMAASFSARSRLESLTATATGTIRVRYRPAMQLDMSAAETGSGASFQVDEIVTGRAAYLKAIRFFGTVGNKPWIKVPDSEPNPSQSVTTVLETGYEFAPAAQIETLATAKTVRAAGIAAIDGVPTMRYTGYYTQRAVAAAQHPAYADATSMIGKVTFSVWIDAGHQVRRLTEDGPAVGGGTQTLTIDITAVDQPVHIAPPPERKVALAPRGNFSG
jgi:hypothetical protein